MSQDHDPVLQSSYIRQCLAQEKRAIGFFLGAGCPMSIRVTRAGKSEPLIPDIAGVTSHVKTELLSSKFKDAFQTVLDYFNSSGHPPPTIEDFLSHIRSLRVVAGADKIRGLSREDLTDLDNTICGSIAILADQRLPASDTPYHRLAAWIGAAERTVPVEIFTTNYDLLMEEALEINRVPYFDGFVGSFSSFLDLQAMEVDHLPARWARLWKIHGSLNWFEDGNRVIHRGVSTGTRRVIYPSHLKYDESRRMPYLAMIDRLRSFLRQPAAVLITSGYSFNDIHLNEVIAQGLQGNPTAVAFALLHGSLKDYGRAVQVAKSRANLNVLAQDEAVIGTKAGAWTRGRSAASCTDSVAVKWTPDPKDPKKKDGTLLLGDFAILADFAENLIGVRQRSEDLLK